MNISSQKKKKSFITLAPGVNVTKLFNGAIEEHILDTNTEKQQS
jgi:hypothetical protein